MRDDGSSSGSGGRRSWRQLGKERRGGGADIFFASRVKKLGFLPEVVRVQSPTKKSDAGVEELLAESPAPRASGPRCHGHIQRRHG
jgi:hypothetical protein